MDKDSKAQGKCMDKDSKGQGKSDDSGGWLLPAMGRHSLEQNGITLTSQQHASVSQEGICSDNYTRCQAADQTFHLTQSQYTDTGPTGPSGDPITPSARQGSRRSTTVKSLS